MLCGTLDLDMGDVVQVCAGLSSESRPCLLPSQLRSNFPVDQLYMCFDVPAMHSSDPPAAPLRLHCRAC